MADILTESGGPFAVKDQQFSEALGIADRRLVFGDRALGSGHRCLLPPEYNRPQPLVNGLPIRLQRPKPKRA